MRVAILYKPTVGPWGGGNSFLRSLAECWRAQQVEVVHQIDQRVDGVLLNSSYLGPRKRLEPAVARRLVSRGYGSGLAERLGLVRWRDSWRPAFVHRLDGVFRLYGRSGSDPADRDQIPINACADWTVYQSSFCQESFARDGADVSRSNVILNGVDLGLFHPAAATAPDNPLRLIMVAWSPNPQKGAAYAAAASEIPGVRVTFVGNWPVGVDVRQVQRLTAVPHAELAPLLREHHAILHPAINDPCSNAVMEGLASGLPVIFHPSGGTPEIVEDAGVACESDIRRAVETLRDGYCELRRRALERRQHLSIDAAAARYLEVFRSLGRMAVR